MSHPLPLRFLKQGRGAARKAVLQEPASGWKVGPVTFQYTAALVSLPLQDSVLNLRTLLGPRPSGQGFCKWRPGFHTAPAGPRDLEQQSCVAIAG